MRVALRFFIGDIREPLRIKRALEGIDTVVHAAALKQFPPLSIIPLNASRPNVLGAQNLIEACLDMSVENVVALSTDKAAAPVNLYGATKLCSDKLFLAAKKCDGCAEHQIQCGEIWQCYGKPRLGYSVFSKATTYGCSTDYRPNHDTLQYLD